MGVLSNYGTSLARLGWRSVREYAHLGFEVLSLISLDLTSASLIGEESAGLEGSHGRRELEVRGDQGLEGHRWGERGREEEDRGHGEEEGEHRGGLGVPGSSAF